LMTTGNSPRVPKTGIVPENKLFSREIRLAKNQRIGSSDRQNTLQSLCIQPQTSCFYPKLSIYPSRKYSSLVDRRRDGHFRFPRRYRHAASSDGNGRESQDSIIHSRNPKHEKVFFQSKVRVIVTLLGHTHHLFERGKKH